MARTTQREEKIVRTDPFWSTRGPTWRPRGMAAGPVPYQGPRGHQDFGGRRSARHLKTGWLEAPGAQRPCSAPSCVCVCGGAELCVGGCPWCDAAGLGGTRVCGPGGRGLEAKLSPRPLGWERIAGTNCKLARLALNAFAASLLLSRPSLPS